MIRKVIQAGNPLLKTKSEHIKDISSESCRELIRDLKDTLEDSGLIGMAGVQIGENKRLFVTHIMKTKSREGNSDKFRVYINPEIVWESEKQIKLYEGCGSVANATLFAPVMRAKEVTIKAFDENGKEFELTTDGILARVILHEYDHLEGIEFLERVEDNKEIIDLEFYKSEIKPKDWHKANSEITKLIVN